MSARDWKLGDAAMVTGSGMDDVAIWAGAFWAWVPKDGSGPFSKVAHAARDIPARPLVVLDPEDREQVERLVRAFVDALPDVEPCTVGRQDDAMRDALHSLIAPPKPAEPQGLGAVVEDAEGVRYVLTHGNSGQPLWVDPFSEWEYDKIAAVRVLSEGVTP